MDRDGPRRNRRTKKKTVCTQAQSRKLSADSANNVVTSELDDNGAISELDVRYFNFSDVRRHNQLGFRNKYKGAKIYYITS